MNPLQFGGALALSLLLAACGEQNTGTENLQVADPGRAASQADQVHSAAGKLTTITGDQVTIAHGPVEEIGWPAMTMTFRAQSSDMVRRVYAGDQVSFAFRQDGSAYVLTSLEKL